jgi:hypothetical protein
VKENAVKHGLLARRIPFQSEQDQVEFGNLIADLCDDYKPVGRTEAALVEEIAVTLWKLAMAIAWEMPQVLNRRQAATAILEVLSKNHDKRRVPLFTEDDGAPSVAQLVWECQGLVVRTGNRGSEVEDQESLACKTRTSGIVQIEAKLNTSLDTMLRYEAGLKRDLYRAIGALRGIQREKREERTN